MLCPPQTINPWSNPKNSPLECTPVCSAQVGDLRGTWALSWQLLIQPPNPVLAPGASHQPQFPAAPGDKRLILSHGNPMPRCQGTQVLGDCGNQAENEQISLLSLLPTAKKSLWRVDGVLVLLVLGFIPLICAGRAAFCGLKLPAPTGAPQKYLGAHCELSSLVLGFAVVAESQRLKRFESGLFPSLFSLHLGSGCPKGGNEPQNLSPKLVWGQLLGRWWVLWVFPMKELVGYWFYWTWRGCLLSQQPCSNSLCPARTGVIPVHLLACFLNMGVLCLCCVTPLLCWPWGLCAPS